MTTTPAQPSILLVDDLDTNLFVLELTLSELDARILMAQSGDAALRLIDAEPAPPALAMLDIHMPGMDGYALALALRQHEKTRDMPIFFITGALADEQAIENLGLDPGSFGFVGKPFDPEDLLEAVAAVLPSRTSAA